MAAALAAAPKPPRSAYALMEAVSHFWSRVLRPEGDDECWLYQGGGNDNGYGIFHFGGRKIYAHRFSFMVSHGRRLPPDVFACHRCDVRLCVRPDHLFLGTAAVNNRDRVVKSRLRKITIDKPEIRPLSARPVTAAERRERDALLCTLAEYGYARRFLAREFDLQLSTVQRIVTRSREYATAA